MQPELVSRGLELRSFDEKARSVDFIASTDALDSYEEIVEQDWDLARFKANPIILYGHQSRELPIGRATRIEVVSVNGRRQLETTIAFVSEKANPKAEQVFQLIKEGALKAVSVGFVPKHARFEKRDGREVFVLGQPDLHEISVVPIPANPEALAKMRAKAREGSPPISNQVDAVARSIVDVGRAAGELKPGGTTAYGKNGASMRLDANGDIHIRAGGAAINEDNMTEKDLQERAAKAEAEKGLAEKQLEDERKSHAATKTALEASEGTVKALTTDRDAWKERAEKAEAAEIANEVDKLVGVKITPAEKDTFVELRKSNQKLFAKMVADRPELKMLKGQVIDDDKSTPPAVLTNEAGNGAGLATKIFGG